MKINIPPIFTIVAGVILYLLGELPVWDSLLSWSTKEAIIGGVQALGGFLFVIGIGELLGKLFSKVKTKKTQDKMRSQ